MVSGAGFERRAGILCEGGGVSFAIQHPWMTFWPIVLGMCLLNGSIGDICNAVKSAKGINAIKAINESKPK